MPLLLVSHDLCPYVQRAVIALTEKGVPFVRRDIDLSNKPGWFLEMSPLGKTPVLQVAQTAVFESSVIVEYLEDTQPNPLHPTDLLERARHRAWIEAASAMLNDIARFYNAPDDAALRGAGEKLRMKANRLEHVLNGGPYFGGADFSLVDAAFGPVFRYFDRFDQIDDFGVFSGLPGVAQWRAALRGRASVKQAVTADYDTRLAAFIDRRGSRLSELQRAAGHIA